MILRLAAVAFLVGASTSPAWAQSGGDVCAPHVDLSPLAITGSGAPQGGAAPADSTFGLYPMSVLGIQNTLRRKGSAVEGSSDRSVLTTGPLACVVDAIRAWERAYPADPWIAKSLLTLELIYLRPRSGVARDLAARTEAWLEHDYPQSNYVDPARLALVDGEPREQAVAVAPVPVARAPGAAVAVVESVASIPAAVGHAAALPAVVAPVVVAPAARVPVAKVPVAHVPVAHVPVARVPVAHVPVAHAPIAHVPVAHAPIAHVSIVHVPVPPAAVAPVPVAAFSASAIRIAVVPIAPISVAMIPVDVTPPVIPFSAEAIVVATAAIPPPATLAEEFPGITRPASPWDRFASLVSERVPPVSK